MYWRLTSKEKPIKQGEIKVLVAWEEENVEDIEHCFAIYDADRDKFTTLGSFTLKTPTHWSYIDELPSEDNEPTEE